MEFAIETGMRLGELLKLRWEDVNLGIKTALIKETKNGDSRAIPLSVAAIGALSGIASPFRRQRLSGHAECITGRVEKGGPKSGNR